MNVVCGIRMLTLGLVLSLGITAVSGAESVRVMSFNLWHGGDAGGQPIEQSVAVIKASKADIVGLQETHGNAPKGKPRPDRAAELAKRLGWHYLDQGGRTGIISRFKIVGSTPRKWGAKLMLPSGKPVFMFNVHFAPSPYQPYQLLNIPYGDHPFLSTEKEAVAAARATRSRAAGRMLAEVKAIESEGAPVFLTGDFNEPSHLDWTVAVAKAELCPLKVHWPTTDMVTRAGFIDAYRTAHSDPVKKRGVTWTPITKTDDPKDKHDRIDFVFGGLDKSRIRVKAAQVVGESPKKADIVVVPYPSDHRAVVAEFELN